MDGLLNTIETNVINGPTGALTETCLWDAIKACYDAGGSPDLILCRPGVALQINNFNKGKLNYTISAGALPEVTAGMQTFKYLSPLGGILEVVPVRQDFLPSGNVIVLTTSDVRLAFLSSPETMVEDVATVTDSVAKLIKSYVTLEHRNEVHSAKIVFVADTYTVTA
jgi:hypothetical protein